MNLRIYRIYSYQHVESARVQQSPQLHIEKIAWFIAQESYTVSSCVILGDF